MYLRVLIITNIFLYTAAQTRNRIELFKAIYKREPHNRSQSCQTVINYWTKKKKNFFMNRFLYFRELLLLLLVEVSIESKNFHASFYIFWFFILSAQQLSSQQSAHTSTSCESHFRRFRIWNKRQRLPAAGSNLSNLAIWSYSFYNYNIYLNSSDDDDEAIVCVWAESWVKPILIPSSRESFWIDFFYSFCCR